MSKKQPYIPIYIGDWEQDTNTISLEAEGALLKLSFKLWKSFAKGLLEISLKQLSILFKKSEEETAKIMHELAQNNVLNIEFFEQNMIKIQSRRMLREAQLSKVRAESGSLSRKQNLSKKEAKHKQNPEYDIENEDENEIENNGLLFTHRGDNFFRAWENWLGYRREIKKPYKSIRSTQMALNKLSKFSEEDAIRMIETAIEKQWQGIWEIDPIKSESKISQQQKKFVEGKNIIDNIFKNEA